MASPEFLPTRGISLPLSGTHELPTEAAGDQGVVFSGDGIAFAAGVAADATERPFEDGVLIAGPVPDGGSAAIEMRNGFASHTGEYNSPQECSLVLARPPASLDPAESHHGIAAAKNRYPTEQADPLLAAVKLVLDAVTSPNTRRMYAHALVVFTEFRRNHAYGFTRAAVHAWRAELEAKGLSASTINQYLAAVRKLASEAAANGLLDAETVAGIQQVAGVRQSGNRCGNWLSRSQAQALIEAPEPNTLKGKRDRCALALLVGCALRRAEAQALTFEHIQPREGRWVIVDLRGKGNRIRTIPVPSWVKAAIDRWAEAARISTGRVLRTIDRHGRIGETLSGWGIWYMAMTYSETLGIDFKPHDLRRTCAKLCRASGGELEQIQMLLGHASVQTTERYLGTKQDLTNAPNDRMGLKWREE